MLGQQQDLRFHAGPLCGQDGFKFCLQYKCTVLDATKKKCPAYFLYIEKSNRGGGYEHSFLQTPTLVYTPLPISSEALPGDPKRRASTRLAVAC